MKIKSSISVNIYFEESEYLNEVNMSSFINFLKYNKEEKKLSFDVYKNQYTGMIKGVDREVKVCEIHIYIKNKEDNQKVVDKINYFIQVLNIEKNIHSNKDLSEHMEEEKNKPPF